MKNSFEILVSHKLKATKERLALLDILSKAGRPVNILDILAQDRKKIMNQATVYRALDRFVQAGIVRQVDLKQGSIYFEFSDPHDHHHMVCEKCGEVEDFVGCDFNHLVKKALSKSKKFKVIKDHSLEMFGLCNSCIN